MRPIINLEIAVALIRILGPHIDTDFTIRRRVLELAFVDGKEFSKEKEVEFCRVTDSGGKFVSQ
jgi:hypothetical protein